MRGDKTARERLDACDSGYHHGMSAESVPRASMRVLRRVRTPELGLYTLFAVATGCSLLLLVVPRAIAPIELPTLTLPAAEVEQVIRDDARRAASAPRSAVAHELRQRFHQFGASEVTALGDARLDIQRRRMLHYLHDRVIASDGAAAILALRAQALAELESALDGRLPAAEVSGVLGVFPNVLSEHRVTRDGEELAPHFVLRTLYKARWNRLFDLPIDSDFARVERIAYFGWLGLHAENLPLAARRLALTKYAAAGGPHASEAQGVLAFLDRDFGQAAGQLERAYAQDHSLRLRNYLRGARVAGNKPADGDSAPSNGVASSPASPTRP
jgi:hypothetical protein